MGYNSFTGWRWLTDYVKDKFNCTPFIMEYRCLDAIWNKKTQEDKWKDGQRRARKKVRMGNRKNSKAKSKAKPQNLFLLRWQKCNKKWKLVTFMQLNNMYWNEANCSHTKEMIQIRYAVGDPVLVVQVVQKQMSEETDWIANRFDFVVTCKSYTRLLWSLDI